MKKIILLFILTVTLISCKKEYNCTCNTTYFYIDNFGLPAQQFFVSQNNNMSAKMAKKQAQSVCDHEAANIDTTWANFNRNGRPNSSFLTHCYLK